MIDKISNHIYNPISGDWGDDINDADDSFTFVLRTTNFTNIGKIDYSDVVKRNIDYKVLEKKLLKYNDIIIEKSGGSDKIPVGRVVFFDIDKSNYICNNFTSIIRCKNTLNSKYLFYYLYQNHKQNTTAYYQNKTTGIRNLQLKRYLDTDIPIPPLPQQEKIVKVLDISSALVEKQKELLKKYDLFLKSKFIEMFGDPISNPMGWEVVKLEKFTTLVSSGSTPKGGQSVYLDEGEIRFIRSQNVRMNKMSYDGIYYISEEVYTKMKRTQVQYNDVLLNITGASIGRTAIYKDKTRANVNQHVCIIRLNKQLNNVYLNYFIATDSFQNKIISNQSGATREALNFTQIKKFDIFYPPLELQNKFASIVEKVEIIKEQETKKLQHLRVLHKSLMDKAFKGEIQ